MWLIARVSVVNSRGSCKHKVRSTQRYTVGCTSRLSTYAEEAFIHENGAMVFSPVIAREVLVGFAQLLEVPEEQTWAGRSREAQ